MRKLKNLIFVSLCMTLYSTHAQNVDYQLPPDAIRSLVEAPLTPNVSISPDRTTLLILQLPSMPSIDEVSSEELRLGGLRINPKTNGSSRSRYYDGMQLKSIDNNEVRSVENLPKMARIENVSWSPSGRYVAFTNTTSQGLELWCVDVNLAQASKLTEAGVNDAISGVPYDWFSQGESILTVMVQKDRGISPVAPSSPAGPVIQENVAGAAPVRTYQDLLRNPHDEALFAYYTEGNLVKINVKDGSSHTLGLEGIFLDVDISPDGSYLLLNRIKRPFSYIVPYYRFAQEVTIYDFSADKERTLANIPAAENIPKGFNAVRTGPRRHAWRSDKPATLYWVEAQDGGDPKQESGIRDRLYSLDAPFESAPKSNIDFTLRFGGIQWGDDELAVAREYWWSTRREIISSWKPGQAGGKQVIFDRSYEDRYTDPGDFQTALNAYGRSTLSRDEDGHLFLAGIGASPEGNRPFLDLFDLQTKTSTRVWQSEAPYYELPYVILDAKKSKLLTRRESNKVTPNFFIRNWRNGKLTQLTDFPDPYASMQGVTKELIKYERKDGIELTGTLYLPAGYDAQKDGRLPVLMWAYPREYKSKSAAGQVRNSPYEFLRLYYGSPIYWVMQGYAVFDNFAMPIIGEGDEESNDRFVPQLVQGAEAAIEKLVDMGIADRDRLAVGGHSYGAFMTANLLAHSDLFAAGIARSGAYNRTLTPFGFQAEERTFWEAPDVYFTMSPFMHADKIKEPLLLIHGEADNNSGTYPMQSKRFYAALKGHGATVRLVMLPHESHGYRAKESILHMMWEMDAWLEKHVKNRSNGQKTKKTKRS